MRFFFISNYKIFAFIFHSGVFLHGVSRGPLPKSEIHTSMLSWFSSMFVFGTRVGNNQGIARYEPNPYIYTSQQKKRYKGFKGLMLKLCTQRKKIDKNRII